MSRDLEPPFARHNATGGTAEAAAEIARKSAGKRRTAILIMLESGPLSPEEIVARFADGGEQVLLTSVRARVCDLRREGLVVDSGLRGLGESQRAKVVKWRLLSQDERAAALREGAEA